jgi:hypothetical protein
MEGQAQTSKELQRRNTLKAPEVEYPADTHNSQIDEKQTPSGRHVEIRLAQVD